MFVCTFKLFSRSQTGQLIELDCYEQPLFLGPHDFLVVQLDREEYPFQLAGTPPAWLWPKQEAKFPDLVLGLLNAALKLGKAVPWDSEGSVTYVLRGEQHIPGIGLCPCFTSRFDHFGTGHMLQLWTGELLQIGFDGGLRLHHDSWTPGKDGTPPQKSRHWQEENGFD